MVFSLLDVVKKLKKIQKSSCKLDRNQRRFTSFQHMCYPETRFKSSHRSLAPGSENYSTSLGSEGSALGGSNAESHIIRKGQRVSGVPNMDRSKKIHKSLTTVELGGITKKIYKSLTPGYEEYTTILGSGGSALGKRR